ncbi:MAG TPA: hypothetical protein PKL65_06865 [Bacteroidales bacterium]|nr:hypothetical protein [Bacteroidales bacterium]HPM18074.1 hypothetical protein [Bacteroidales bacterium]
MIKIFGIKIIDRIKEAGLTQMVLSRHSGVITTRLGFHELSTELCSREAYIILHLSAGEREIAALKADLNTIGGISLNEISFDDSRPYTGFSGEEGALRVIGILIENRDKDAIMSVQKTLTAYGCVIRTRLGVNEEFLGRPAGLVLLELTGDEIQMDLLEKDLLKLPGIILGKMVL